jgi:serine/threonine protein kinase
MLAVKQVEMPQTSSDKDNDAHSSNVTALKFEIQTLKDMDHVNIVQYLGFEETTEFLSIFLEYVPGGSVGRCIRKHFAATRTGFEEPLVKHFTIQIISALSYLHKRGILHRDLKADNVLVDNEGNCKISDFGISKRSDDIYNDNVEMSMQGSIFWSGSFSSR